MKIDDVVDAYARLVDLPHDSDIYDTASGFSCGTNTLDAIARNGCSKKLRVRYWFSRRTDVRIVVLDSRNLMQCLNEAPAVSLDEGLVKSQHGLGRQS